MYRWKVKINKKCEAEITKMLEENDISDEEYNVIRDWIKFVMKNGPYKLKDFPFYNFNDHELIRDKKWKNCRSSSFSYSGRIIYKIKDNVVTVEVLRITNDHNYK